MRFSFHENIPTGFCSLFCECICKIRLPFSYVPNEHNFVNFLRFVDMFTFKSYVPGLF
jgi:hypothetical protein